MDEQTRNNIETMFDKIREVALEKEMVPVGFLLLTPENDLCVASPLRSKADIRSMLVDYVNQMGQGSHETEEHKW